MYICIYIYIYTHIYVSLSLSLYIYIHTYKKHRNYNNHTTPNKITCLRCGSKRPARRPPSKRRAWTCGRPGSSLPPGLHMSEAYKRGRIKQKKI